METIMTRINIVPPEELADQHLMAEYREIFMVGSSLQRSMTGKNWETKKQQLPKVYTLNKGHVSFFYNKGKYLAKRYLELRKELLLRGYDIDLTRDFKVEQWPAELYNDWTPTVEEQAIARSRIAYRFSQKSDWYKWTAPGFKPDYILLLKCGA